MRQTFVVLKEQSSTRVAQLAARGRGGYIVGCRGASQLGGSPSGIPLRV